MSHQPPSGERPRWLDAPRNVDRVVHTLYLVCALLLAIDLLDLVGVLYHKHGHFGIEALPGFYGLYGFFGSVGLVLTAKWMRRGLKRRETYYEE